MTFNETAWAIELQAVDTALRIAKDRRREALTIQDIPNFTFWSIVKDDALAALDILHTERRANV